MLDPDDFGEIIQSMPKLLVPACIPFGYLTQASLPHL